MVRKACSKPAIGRNVDAAMVAIERDNPRLKGVPPKGYPRGPGELINLIGTISLLGSGTPLPYDSEKTHRSIDILGRFYECFLAQFASAEGRNDGLAKCEVRYASGEVKKSRPFVIRNPAFEIFRADTGKVHADTFRNVRHPDLRAGVAFNITPSLRPSIHTQ